LSAQKELNEAERKLTVAKSNLDLAYSAKGSGFSLAKVINAKNNLKDSQEEYDFRFEVVKEMEQMLKDLF
jgi:hypothetical protein